MFVINVSKSAYGVSFLWIECFLLYLIHILKAVWVGEVYLQCLCALNRVYIVCVAPVASCVDINVLLSGIIIDIYCVSPSFIISLLLIFI